MPPDAWYSPDEIKDEADGGQRQPEFSPEPEALTQKEQRAIWRAEAIEEKVAAILASADTIRAIIATEITQ